MEMTDWTRLSEEEKDDLAAEFPPERLYDDEERIPTTAQMEQDRRMRERAEKADSQTEGWVKVIRGDRKPKD